MHLIASVCPLPNDVRPPRSENILGTQKRTATRDLSMSNSIFLYLCFFYVYTVRIALENLVETHC